MEPENHSHRRYLSRFVVTMVAGILAVAGFNLWVDAYRLFRVFPETPLTAVKVQPESNIGPIKVLNAIAAQPRCVILGNSRADIGFDPKHRGWGTCRDHVYNMAIPGAGINRVRDDFRALVERVHVERALLAVDFQDFVLNAYPVGTPTRNPRPPPERMLREERLRALFTLGGLADSITTLRSSRRPYPATIEADGLNPLLDYLAIAERDGYPAMFRQRLNETTANYVRSRKGIYPPGADDSAEFEALRDILAIASDNGIQLDIVTYPYHAQYYLMFEQVGVWHAFEQWKRRLLLTVTEHSTGSAGALRPRLWDFAAVSGPATEAVEDSAERGSGKWYWEAGHFKQALGDLLLDEIFGPEDRARPGLGAELTPTTIDGWLQSQTAALAHFAKSQPGQLAEVQAAVAQARKSAAQHPAK